MAGICKPSCATVLPNFGAIDDCDIEKALTSGEEMCKRVVSLLNGA